MDEVSNDVLEERVKGVRRDLDKLQASVIWVWRAVAAGMIGIAYQLIGIGMNVGG